ncbi:mucin-17-like [Ixodes scapularis]
MASSVLQHERGAMHRIAPRSHVDVVVDGHAFHIERQLLIECSPFFRKTLEKPENCHKNKLKLSGVSAATFAVLYNYMTTGKLDMSPEIVADVFNAAFRLHMSDVVKKCIQVETETTPIGQQILMYSAARRLNLTEEERRAYNFLTAHFMSVVATKEFLEMDVDDIVLLMSADTIGCHCEAEVFEAGMSWLNYAPEQRLANSEKVMSAVRFDQMNLSELNQCLDYPGLPEMVAVKKIVIDAITSWISNEIGNKAHSDKKMTRQYTPLERKSNVSVAAEDDELCSVSASGVSVSADPASATYATSDRSLTDNPLFQTGATLVLKDQAKTTASADTLGASQGDERSANFFRANSATFFRPLPTNTAPLGRPSHNASSFISTPMTGDSSGSFVEEKTQEHKVSQTRTEEVRTVHIIRKSRSSRHRALNELSPWSKTDTGNTASSAIKSGGTNVVPAAGKTAEDQRFVVPQSSAKQQENTAQQQKTAGSRKSVEEHSTRETKSERALSTSYASSQYSFGEVASADQMRAVQDASPDSADVVSAPSPVSTRPSTVSVGEMGAFSERSDSVAESYQAKDISRTSSMYSLAAEEQDLTGQAPWRHVGADRCQAPLKNGNSDFGNTAIPSASEKSFPAFSWDSAEMSEYQTGSIAKSLSEEKSTKDKSQSLEGDAPVTVPFMREGSMPRSNSMEFEHAETMSDEEMKERSVPESTTDADDQPATGSALNVISKRVVERDIPNLTKEADMFEQSKMGAPSAMELAPDIALPGISPGTTPQFEKLAEGAETVSGSFSRSDSGTPSNALEVVSPNSTDPDEENRQVTEQHESDKRRAEEPFLTAFSEDVVKKTAALGTRTKLDEKPYRVASEAKAEADILSAPEENTAVENKVSESSVFLASSFERSEELSDSGEPKGDRDSPLEDNVDAFGEASEMTAKAPTQISAALLQELTQKKPDFDFAGMFEEAVVQFQQTSTPVETVQEVRSPKDETAMTLNTEFLSDDPFVCDSRASEAKAGADMLSAPEENTAVENKVSDSSVFLASSFEGSQELSSSGEPKGDRDSPLEDIVDAFGEASEMTAKAPTQISAALLQELRQKKPDSDFAGIFEEAGVQFQQTSTPVETAQEVQSSKDETAMTLNTEFLSDDPFVCDSRAETAPDSAGKSETFSEFSNIQASKSVSLLETNRFFSESNERPASIDVSLAKPEKLQTGLETATAEPDVDVSNAEIELLRENLKGSPLEPGECLSEAILNFGERPEEKRKILSSETPTETEAPKMTEESPDKPQEDKLEEQSGSEEGSVANEKSTPGELSPIEAGAAEEKVSKKLYEKVSPTDIKKPVIENTQVELGEDQELTKSFEPKTTDGKGYEEIEQESSDPKKAIVPKETDFIMPQANPEWTTHQLAGGKSSSVFSSDAEVPSASSTIPTIGTNGLTPPAGELRSVSGESMTTGYMPAVSEGVGSDCVTDWSQVPFTTTSTLSATSSLQPATHEEHNAQFALSTSSATDNVSGQVSGLFDEKSDKCSERPLLTLLMEARSDGSVLKDTLEPTTSNEFERPRSVNKIQSKECPSAASETGKSKSTVPAASFVSDVDILSSVMLGEKTKPLKSTSEKGLGERSQQYVLHKTRIFASTPTYSVELVDDNVTPFSILSEVTEESSAKPKPDGAPQENKKSVPSKKTPSQMGDEEEDESSMKESSDSDTPPVREHASKRKRTRSQRRAASKPPVLQRTRIYAEGVCHSVELISEKSVVKGLESLTNAACFCASTKRSKSRSHAPSLVQKMADIKDVLDLSTVSEENENAINATPKAEATRKMENISKKLSELNFKRAILQNASQNESNQKRAEQIMKRVLALNRAEVSLQKNLSTLAYTNSSVPTFGSKSEEIFSSINRDNSHRESEHILPQFSKEVFMAKVNPLPTTINTPKPGITYEDTPKSSHDMVHTKTGVTVNGHMLPDTNATRTTFVITGPDKTRMKIQMARPTLSSEPSEVQTFGDEKCADSDGSFKTGKENSDRKTMSEPSLLSSKHVNTNIEIESSSFPEHMYIAQQREVMSTTAVPLKDQSSVTDTEAFRMVFLTAQSMGRSSTNNTIADTTPTSVITDDQGQHMETARTAPAGPSLASGPQNVPAPPFQAPGSEKKFSSQLPIKIIKKTLVLETVTKTVIEKKESSKVVTDTSTGLEHKDTHLESTTKEEVQSKREEESIESYDSNISVLQRSAAFNEQEPTPETTAKSTESIPRSALVMKDGSVATSPSISVASDKPKRIKQPVAIRVYDDTMVEEERESPSFSLDDQQGDEQQSSLKPLDDPNAMSSLPAEPDERRRIEFQDSDEVKIFEVSTPQMPNTGVEEEEGEASPPPLRFKLNRKDSIAVTKLRMLKEHEDLSDEDVEDEDEGKEQDSFLASNTAGDDKAGATHHPVFQAPTVIPIIAETSIATDGGDEEGLDLNVAQDMAQAVLPPSQTTETTQDGSGNATQDDVATDNSVVRVDGVIKSDQDQAGPSQPVTTSESTEFPIIHDARKNSTVKERNIVSESSVNRSVKEIKNIENSIVTSETEEVYYYPREKVTKKHISETKVLTETRSYTEIVIEPNLSNSSFKMPDIPEDDESLKALQSHGALAQSFSDLSMNRMAKEQPKSFSKEASLSTEPKETEEFRGAPVIFRSQSENATKQTSVPTLFREQFGFAEKVEPVNQKHSVETSVDFVPSEPREPAKRAAKWSTKSGGTNAGPDAFGEINGSETASSDFETCKGPSDRPPSELSPLRPEHKPLAPLFEEQTFTKEPKVTTEKDASKPSPNFPQKRWSEDEYYGKLQTNKKEAIPWSTKPSENKTRKKRDNGTEETKPFDEQAYKAESLELETWKAPPPVPPPAPEKQSDTKSLPDTSLQKVLEFTQLQSKPEKSIPDHVDTLPIQQSQRGQTPLTMSTGQLNDDEPQPYQGQPGGHDGSSSALPPNQEAEGSEKVTKEELERYIKLVKELQLRRGSAMPPSGTLQPVGTVVTARQKPSLVMETRIELFGKGRVTFSFDAVAEEGGGVCSDDSHTSLVRKGAPSTTHTPKRTSIDVRVPPPTPATSMDLLKRKSVDFGHWEGEDSMRYEPREPPNAVSQAAKRRHSEHAKGQPGDDLNKRRHSEPGTLTSGSKEGTDEKGMPTSTLELQSERTIGGEEPLFPSTAGSCLPCDVLTRAELLAEAAILAASLEAQLRKASKEAEARDSPGPDGTLSTSLDYIEEPPKTLVPTETPASDSASENVRTQFGSPTEISSKKAPEQALGKPDGEVPRQELVKRLESVLSDRSLSPDAATDEEGYATCESRMGAKSSEAQSSEELTVPRGVQGSASGTVKEPPSIKALREEQEPAQEEALKEETLPEPLSPVAKESKVKPEILTEAAPKPKLDLTVEISEQNKFKPESTIEMAEIKAATDLKPAAPVEAIAKEVSPPTVKLSQQIPAVVPEVVVFSPVRAVSTRDYETETLRPPIHRDEAAAGGFLDFTKYPSATTYKKSTVPPTIGEKPAIAELEHQLSERREPEFMTAVDTSLAPVQEATKKSTSDKPVEQYGFEPGEQLVAEKVPEKGKPFEAAAPSAILEQPVTGITLELEGPHEEDRLSVADQRHSLEAILIAPIAEAEPAETTTEPLQQPKLLEGKPEVVDQRYSLEAILLEPVAEAEPAETTLTNPLQQPEVMEGIPKSTMASTLTKALERREPEFMTAVDTSLAPVQEATKESTSDKPVEQSGFEPGEQLVAEKVPEKGKPFEAAAPSATLEQPVPGITLELEGPLEEDRLAVTDQRHSLEDILITPIAEAEPTETTPEPLQQPELLEGKPEVVDQRYSLEAILLEPVAGAEPADTTPTNTLQQPEVMEGIPKSTMAPTLTKDLEVASPSEAPETEAMPGYKALPPRDVLTEVREESMVQAAQPRDNVLVERGFEVPALPKAAHSLAEFKGFESAKPEVEKSPVELEAEVAPKEAKGATSFEKAKVPYAPGPMTFNVPALRPLAHPETDTRHEPERAASVFEAEKAGMAEASMTSSIPKAIVEYNAGALAKPRSKNDVMLREGQKPSLLAEVAEDVAAQELGVVLSADKPAPRKIEEEPTKAELVGSVDEMKKIWDEKPQVDEENKLINEPETAAVTDQIVPEVGIKLRDGDTASPPSVKLEAPLSMQGAGVEEPGTVEVAGKQIELEATQKPTDLQTEKVSPGEVGKHLKEGAHVVKEKPEVKELEAFVNEAEITPQVETKAASATVRPAPSGGSELAVEKPVFSQEFEPRAEYELIPEQDGRASTEPSATEAAAAPTSEEVGIEHKVTNDTLMKDAADDQAQLDISVEIGTSSPEATDIKGEREPKVSSLKVPEVVLEEEKRVREILEYETSLSRARGTGTVPRSEELLHVSSPLPDHAEAPELVPPGEKLSFSEGASTPESAGFPLFTAKAPQLPSAASVQPDSEQGKPILDPAEFNKGPMSDWETELQELRESRLHETPYGSKEEPIGEVPGREVISGGEGRKPEGARQFIITTWKEGDKEPPPPTEWPGSAAPSTSYESAASQVDALIIVYERDVLGLITPDYEIKIKNEREVKRRAPEQEETKESSAASPRTFIRSAESPEPGPEVAPELLFHHVSFPEAQGPEVSAVVTERQESKPVMKNLFDEKRAELHAPVEPVSMQETLEAAQPEKPVKDIRAATAGEVASERPVKPETLDQKEQSPNFEKETEKSSRGRRSLGDDAGASELPEGTLDTDIPEPLSSNVSSESKEGAPAKTDLEEKEKKKLSKESPLPDGKKEPIDKLDVEPRTILPLFEVPPTDKAEAKLEENAKEVEPENKPAEGQTVSLQEPPTGEKEGPTELEPGLAERDKKPQPNEPKSLEENEMPATKETPTAKEAEEEEVVSKKTEPEVASEAPEKRQFLRDRPPEQQLEQVPEPSAEKEQQVEHEMGLEVHAPLGEEKAAKPLELPEEEEPKPGAQPEREGEFVPYIMPPTEEEADKHGRVFDKAAESSNERTFLFTKPTHSEEELKKAEGTELLADKTPSKRTFLGAKPTPGEDVVVAKPEPLAEEPELPAEDKVEKDKQPGPLVEEDPDLVEQIADFLLEDARRKSPELQKFGEGEVKKTTEPEVYALQVHEERGFLEDKREEVASIVEGSISPELVEDSRSILPKRFEDAELIPQKVEEMKSLPLSRDEAKRQEPMFDWDIGPSQESLPARPATRTADTQTEMSTDLFRTKDVREASTYAFLSEEAEEGRRAPDDYLPLYLHRVTLNDKPSIAEMIRKLTPCSEEWEESVPMNWKINPAKRLEKWPSPCVQDVRTPTLLLLGGINLSALEEVLTGTSAIVVAGSD